MARTPPVVNTAAEATTISQLLRSVNASLSIRILLVSGTFHRSPAQGFLSVRGSRWWYSLLISRLAGLGQIACGLIRGGGCQWPAASPTVQGHCATCLVASFIELADHWPGRLPNGCR
ncbi:MULTISPECIES: hypothetical protein [Prochlorococcus]|uniref:hypothetical protein n=1 Tax=Prochlorococcus TaxID=1218 RepID=UPI001F249A9A|nr:hypothetical protein [Prochlorococcus marinus]